MSIISIGGHIVSIGGHGIALSGSSVPAAASSTVLASFAGAAGTQPAGVVCSPANAGSLDGAGHYVLTSGSLMFSAGAQPDGYVGVTLATPGSLGFIFASSLDVSNCYYIGADTGKIGVYTIVGGRFGSVIVAPTVLTPTGLFWQIQSAGTRHTLYVDDALILTFVDSTFTASGYVGVRMLEGSSTALSLASAIYETPAQADASFLVRHPPTILVTGAG